MAVTDGAGTVKESYRYSAFGQPTIFNAAGSEIASSAVTQPFLFTGARWDEESSLYQMRLRYYDPVAGRFVSRDPLGMWGDASQRGNGQGYCGGDPVNLRDPMGLDPPGGGGLGERSVGPRGGVPIGTPVAPEAPLPGLAAGAGLTATATGEAAAAGTMTAVETSTMSVALPLLVLAGAAIDVGLVSYDLYLGVSAFTTYVSASAEAGEQEYIRQDLVRRLKHHASDEEIEEDGLVVNQDIVKEGRKSRRADDPFRTEEHHLLPVALEEQFEALGFDVDNWVIDLNYHYHRAIHERNPNTGALTGGGMWNSEWKKFFDERKCQTIDPREVQSFLRALVTKYGLVPWMDSMHRYRRAGPPD